MNDNVKKQIEVAKGQVRIEAALQSKWFGTQWSCENSDYNKLEWRSVDIPKPSKEEINIEVKRLEVEYSQINSE